MTYRKEPEPNNVVMDFALRKDLDDLGREMVTAFEIQCREGTAAANDWVLENRRERAERLSRLHPWTALPTGSVSHS